MESTDPRAVATVSGPDVDLTDPNRYCTLCAATFNNPQMALQHYNGRKHQRNQSRNKLLKELGNKVQQGNTVSVFLCLGCNIWMDGFNHRICSLFVSVVAFETDLGKTEMQTYFNHV